MALFFCSSSRVSNLKSYSWMLLFFFMTVTLSALNAPSLSDYMTIQRRQRRSDQWIAQALNRICPWAECQGWIGCRQTSNPPSPCPTTPRNFVELWPYDVKGPRRMSLGTCYGYSPPDNPAPFDRCKGGPKKDECACISSDRILRIGYSEQGKTHPQDDAPIGDLCASKIASPCTTTPPPPPTLPPTTSFTTLVSTTGGGPTEVPTGLLTTRTLTPPMTATTPTAMTTANRSANSVVPTGSSSSADNGPITGAPSAVTELSTPRNEEGSNGVPHFLIWPPLLVALVLVCLLVALYRRRRRPSKTPADVNVGFSAKNTAAESPMTPAPRDDVTVSNPSYERHVSGNELNRSGDFFCPPLDTIPRTPNSGRDRSISPGHDGDVHGRNAAAALGHFNVAFSEGNYSDVRQDPEDVWDEKLTSYKPISPREDRYLHYSQDGDIIPSTAIGGSSSQPTSKVQPLSADGYEDAPVFSFAHDTTDATSAYETATADQQNYTTSDNPHPRERTARPAADLHYEAVSPAGHSPNSTDVYAYATTSAYPAGLRIVSDNQYNVLQTPVKENDGEYSMLKRSVGGSDATSPHGIVSSNEYNKIVFPLIKH